MESDNPPTIIALAESIQTLGLLHPITITATGHRLVAGLHRLEACKSLGWKTIPVIRLTVSDLDAELAEIDENLIRNELTELEQSLALVRRKEIYEARFPETKKGSAPGAGRGKGKKKIEKRHDVVLPKSFASDTATKTGKATRSVQRQTKIGQALKGVAEAGRATSY